MFKSSFLSATNPVIFANIGSQQQSRDRFCDSKKEKIVPVEVKSEKNSMKS